MTELRMLQDLGAELDPPQPDVPARVRNRVLAGLAEPQRRTRAGFGWRIAGAGGLALAVTAGVLVTQVASFDDRAPASKAEAARILEDAAARAGSAPTVAVRGDQFVYVDSITAAASGPANESPKVTVNPGLRRVWYSVDGSRDGLMRSRPRSGRGDWKNQVLPGCHDGKMTARKGDQTFEVPCEPATGYRADLPTDTDDMLKFLYEDLGNKNPDDQEAFTKAGDTIREAYVPPASLAAMFGALARIPGVTVVGDVIDEAGRAGVAVSLTEVQGSRAELIFDRTTHAYLGERVVDVDGGRFRNSTAVLTVAIVDEAGRLP